MADQIVSQLTNKPGLQRDGTDLDSQLYTDGQWVRFVRAGRPKKMGGYKTITDDMTGPIRQLFVWSRQVLNTIYSFSSSKVEVLSTNADGVGAGINDRTPVTRTIVLTPIVGTMAQGAGITGGTSGATGTIAKLSGTTATLVYVTGIWQNAEVATDTNGNTATTSAYMVTPFVGGDNYNWQIDSMYDAAANSNKSVILAHAAPNLAAIDDGTLTPIFIGDITDLSKPLEDTGQVVSGGIVTAPPYLISYGSDGQITWCNENEPLNIYTVSATTTRALADKIVKGLPMRSGQGTSVLLWALDSVIKLTWVGGTAIFRIDTISSQSSILSSSSVIEYDGVYFWIGIDRFLTYNGTLAEVPNTTNFIWFFENLNFAQRQKVQALKIPKYGEIWWLFPFGDSVECNHAIIYNVRLNCWYDTAIDRSAGYYSQVFHYPVMAASVISDDVIVLPFAGGISGGGFGIGDTVMGGTSGATGIVHRVQGTNVYVEDPVLTFLSGETVTGAHGGSGVLSASPTTAGLYAIWQHEVGVDMVNDNNENGVAPIQSYYQTADFGYPTGSIQEQLQGPDRWTRLTRVEPDFKQVGPMTCEVVGRPYARGDYDVSQPYVFQPDTERIDMREQRREIHMKYESNILGGDYEEGKTLYHIEVGDARGK